MLKAPGFWAACVAGVVVVLVIVVNVFGSSSPGPKHTVVYSVTGTVQTPTIYYFDSARKTQSVKGHALPWTLTMTVHGDPVGFRVGAVRKGNSGHARLTCTIRVDGTVKVTRTTTETDPQVRCAN